MNHIYPEKESKLIEFKERLDEGENILRTCVAFANGPGGEIIIGVEDQTRRITGVSEQDEKRFYESLPNKIFDSISPTIIPDFFERNLGNKNVLIIRVHQGSKRPYFLKKEGIPKGVYVRIGPHTRRATESYLEELVASNTNITFDAETIKGNNRSNSTTCS